MLVVMALGGNALLRRGQPLEAEVQRRNLLYAVAKAVAPIARRHQPVITHGNGPQVGLLALQAAAYKEVCSYPLDVLGAESEGMIGYLIEQALSNELPGREIATLLTQVEVDSSDPAFAKPSKPIGPIYGEAEARELSARTSWTFMPTLAAFGAPCHHPLRVVFARSTSSNCWCNREWSLFAPVAAASRSLRRRTGRSAASRR